LVAIALVIPGYSLSFADWGSEHPDTSSSVIFPAVLFEVAATGLIVLGWIFFPKGDRLRWLLAVPIAMVAFWYFVIAVGVLASISDPTV
jgi:hypothetical protein